MGIDDAGPRGGTQSLDDISHLLGIGPILTLLHNRDATAKRSKRLRSTAEKPTYSGAHRVHDKIAIIAIQKKYETQTGMICMHGAKRFNQVIVICGSIAKKENIDLSRAQSLKAIGDFASTATNSQPRLTA